MCTVGACKKRRFEDSNGLIHSVPVTSDAKESYIGKSPYEIPVVYSPHQCRLMSDQFRELAVIPWSISSRFSVGYWAENDMRCSSVRNGGPVAAGCISISSIAGAGTRGN